jgi:hypothetical protein
MREPGKVNKARTTIPSDFASFSADFGLHVSDPYQFNLFRPLGQTALRDHGSPSPFINAQPDDSFEDDLREALLELDMGPQFDVAAQRAGT